MVQRLFALLPFLFVAACEQPGRPSTEYRPTEAGTVDHALCLLGFSAVPVRDVDPGHQLIEATINGHTANFVLDTGANVTVVTTSQAQRFGLSSRRGGQGGRGGALRSGAPANADLVAIDSFEIGSITVRQSHVVLADLGQLLTALGRASGAEVVGIIGQDVLNEHRAIIDVARPMLYLIEDDRDPAPIPADECQSAEAEGRA
jgi:clan AA aspartic protease (TIGR02281 family)